MGLIKSTMLDSSNDDFERARAEHNKVFEEMREKYERMLLKHFNEEYKDVPNKIEFSSMVVVEKIHLLVQRHFEKELARIYRADETDPVMIARQNDLIMDMLYATDLHLISVSNVNEFKLKEGIN